MINDRFQRGTDRRPVVGEIGVHLPEKHRARDSCNFPIRDIRRVIPGKATSQTVPGLARAPHNYVIIACRVEVYIQDAVGTGGAAKGGLGGVAMIRITTVREGVAVQVRDEGVIARQVRCEEVRGAQKTLPARRELAACGSCPTPTELTSRAIRFAHVAATENAARPMVWCRKGNKLRNGDRPISPTAHEILHVVATAHRPLAVRDDRHAPTPLIGRHVEDADLLRTSTIRSPFDDRQNVLGVLRDAPTLILWMGSPVDGEFQIKGINRQLRIRRKRSGKRSSPGRAEPSLGGITAMSVDKQHGDPRRCATTPQRPYGDHADRDCEPPSLA